jgi:ribonucleotide monophosphatase NagD (HAD superfamily)
MESIVKKPTVFCDIDGTIFRYRKFETYRTSVPEVLPGVKKTMHRWQKEGVYIVLTTARPEYLRDHTIGELEDAGIPYDQLIMGIGRGSRYIINDSEDPNKPRAFAVPLNRDTGFNFII